MTSPSKESESKRDEIMQGQLYIDGHDAFAEYGVYIVDEGLNDLIAMPPLKTVVTNDWQEEDGVEADLLSPQLKPKMLS